MKNLQEKSPIYYAEAEIYDLFAQAEDAKGCVCEALAPLVRGKNVLDVGCGTGKYLELLAPFALHITGIDAAPAQLSVARRHAAGLPNVALVPGDALAVELPKAKYDIALACWMLGTVADDARRLEILRRLEGLIVPGGVVIAVENAEGSEFENIRGRVNDPLLRTRRYNEWLKRQGFLETHLLNSWFQFESIGQAGDVFAAIWGEDKRPLINDSRIEHKIAIYQKRIGI